jgi:hypothetical protein
MPFAPLQGVYLGEQTMSTHPNAILLLALTPQNLARKTYRAIIEESGVPLDGDGSASITISGQMYHSRVMESDYDEGMQISAKEGDLVFHAHVTYGYGDVITWDALAAHKEALEAWAKGICERHSCDYEIFVTANYW